MAIKDTLTTVTDGFKTKLDDEMLQRFEIYFKLLVEWNEKMNLTAITDEHGVAVKHFADSLNKRLTFLDTVLNDTGLDSELVHSRAEEGGKNKLYREKFDIAVSRAVARLNVLSEYCLPYVKVGGLFVAMKGPNADEELDGAENALKLLGGKVEKVHKFNLPCDEGERTIIVIKKVKPTPKQYPRISGKIKSQPL